MIKGHFAALSAAVGRLETHEPRIEAWGSHLAAALADGRKLLTCGNGGSAAQAQHLSGELLGKYDRDRRPLSAVALHADTSAATAIINDYGAQELFARQVRAHGRPGDVLLSLSTSGQSHNICAAAKTAHEIGMTTWALTGSAPNNLASLCDDSITVDALHVATVQEVHLAVLHALCAALDDSLDAAGVIV